MDLTSQIDLRGIDVPVGGAIHAHGPVALEPLALAGQEYRHVPPEPELRVDVVRTLGAGWHLRLRGDCSVEGPCWVCLADADIGVRLDATEVHDASGDDPDMESSYVTDGVLDVAAWARDAVAEALPSRVVCRPDCKGLCPRCGADLNAGECTCPPPEPDPRWGPLADLAARMKNDDTD